MPLPPPAQFLLDQPYSRRALLPPVGDQVNTQGGRVPGLLLHWGQVHDEGVVADAANAGRLKPILASPGAKGYEREKIGGHKQAADWIRRKAPQTDAEWDQTVDDAVAAQFQLRTAGLILPSRLLSQPDWPDGLQSALDAARRGAARHPTADMLVNLILGEPWILDPRLRRTLLNQFTDLPEDLGAAIHIHWSSPERPDQPASLEALRIVVSALANDGRRVLLVEAAGWAGWRLPGAPGASRQGSRARAGDATRRSSGAPRVSPPLASRGSSTTTCSTTCARPPKPGCWPRTATTSARAASAGSSRPRHLEP